MFEATKAAVLKVADAKGQRTLRYLLRSRKPFSEADRSASRELFKAASVASPDCVRSLSETTSFGCVEPRHLLVGRANEVVVSQAASVLHVVSLDGQLPNFGQRRPPTILPGVDHSGDRELFRWRRFEKLTIDKGGMT